jgi:ABC-2 type transport system permease protein
MGVAVLTLMMANLMMVVGWAEYFPWAVPIQYAQGESSLTSISYWIVVFTSLAGMIATYLWWKYADQNR